MRSKQIAYAKLISRFKQYKFEGLALKNPFNLKVSSELPNHLNPWAHWQGKLDAKKIVLKRLLELNHKVYEEEIKQGLHKIADVEKFYEQKGEAIPVQVRLLMGSKGKEKKPSTKKKQVDGGLFGEGE